MTRAALTAASELIDGKTIDEVTNWADDYRRDHPGIGPCHYINIPLADSKIDLVRRSSETQNRFVHRRQALGLALPAVVQVMLGQT